MNIFKSIIRIDYPLNYSLLDNLGQELEFIQQKTLEDKKFINSQGNIDLLNHSIRQSGKYKKDSYSLNLSLRTLDMIIIHSEGVEIEFLQSGKPIKLFGEMIKKLSVKTFERIGFRFWVIIEHDNYKFDLIKEYISNSNKLFSDTIKKQFTEVSDIALVYESHSEQDNTRISLGPYQEGEEKKYDFQSPNIKEGLIFDIDLWENKIKTPNFNLHTNLTSKLEIVRQTINVINEKLTGALT
jgi:hypothetical protein